MMDLSTQVLIVGGGPVGLSSAIGLARQGIHSIVVEKHPSTTNHPKARGVATRTMELFRQWGIEPGLRKHELGQEALRFTWLESLTGEELTRVSARRPKQSFSPAPASLISQDIVESQLAKCAQQYPQIDLCFNTRMQTFKQGEEGVAATLLDTNTQTEYQVNASYMIAADGASSPIRAHLGVNMQGRDNLGEFCNIYCEMDLSPWVAHRPSVGFFFTREDVMGTVILSVDGAKRWLVGVRYDVIEGFSKETFSDEFCIDLVKRVIDVPEVEVTFINKAFWSMAALIAEDYRVKRIFLAGDAAHRLPPTGGLGMNTGIQDAHNLAWKLAMVLKGQAGEACLETYTQERAPIALQNIQWSAGNAERMNVIFTALYENDKATAKAALDDQYKHLNHIGLDLGFRYEQGVLAQEDSEPPAMYTDRYVPSTYPGCRAPHYELMCGSEMISTLDLFDTQFVLLSSDQTDNWHKAVAAMSDKPITSYRIGAAGELQDPQGKWLEIYQINPDGAVLVRPDGHVAWRLVGMAGDPLEVLTEWLSKLLYNS